MPWYKEHARTIMTVMYFTNHVALLGQIQLFKKARKRITMSLTVLTLGCSHIQALRICSIEEKRKYKVMLESPGNQS